MIQSKALPIKKVLEFCFVRRVNAKAQMDAKKQLGAFQSNCAFRMR